MNNKHIPTMPQENNRISSNKTLILDYDIEFFGEKGGNFIIISSAVFDGVGGMAMGYKAAETAAEYLKILDKESISAFDIRKCIEQT